MTVDDLVKATSGYYLSNKARSGTGVVIGRLLNDTYELTPEGHAMVATFGLINDIPALVEEKPVTRTRKREKSLIE
jgi:hypothetical protein